MDEKINEIWEKAMIVPEYNKDKVRMDCCGAWILKSEYGNHNSIYGWEIDHAYPLSKGGGDEIENLRPMQWENNLAKGNDYPVYNVVVQADKNDKGYFPKNIYSHKIYKVSDELMEQLERTYKKKS